MSKKLHAQHNEEVCRILTEKGTCNDWVVTTAFYSSLHYVQHEIFPLTEGLREYNTFDNYYNSFPFGGKRPSRHDATIDLVWDNMPDCGESYQFLFQTCKSARYHNYKIPESVTKKALDHLDNIKGALQK
jgi:hypothetical protein